MVRVHKLKQVGKEATKSGLKRVASTVDRAFTPSPGIVVLVYHRVGGRAKIEIDLPLSVFEAQIDAIVSTRRVPTLDQALDDLAAGEQPAATPPVVLTFDDGTDDFVTFAMPILEKANVPAVLYIATDFIESGRSFPNDGRPLSWSALSDLLSTGLVTIGSHSHTHPRFDRIPPHEAAKEITVSVGLIRDRLGVDPCHFAYPYGVLGIGENEVRSRFRSAAVGTTRPNSYAGTDPHRLRRSPIQVSDGMRYFENKVAGGLWLEDTVRQVVNRSHPALSYLRTKKFWESAASAY